MRDRKKFSLLSLREFPDLQPREVSQFHGLIVGEIQIGQRSAFSADASYMVS